jgi:hypothetical protein
MNVMVRVSTLEDDGGRGFSGVGGGRLRMGVDEARRSRRGGFSSRRVGVARSTVGAGWGVLSRVMAVAVLSVGRRVFALEWRKVRGGAVVRTIEAHDCKREDDGQVQKLASTRKTCWYRYKGINEAHLAAKRLFGSVVRNLSRTLIGGIEGWSGQGVERVNKTFLSRRVKTILEGGKRERQGQMKVFLPESPPGFLRLASLLSSILCVALDCIFEWKWLTSAREARLFVISWSAWSGTAQGRRPSSWGARVRDGW